MGAMMTGNDARQGRAAGKGGPSAGGARTDAAYRQPMRLSRSVKVLIAFKAMLIAVLALAYSRVIRLGELGLSAQDSNSNAAADAPAADEDAIDAVGEKLPAEAPPAVKDPGALAQNSVAGEPSPSPAAADPAAAGEGEATERKSFLDDLLTLPKLDPDSVKREEIARYLNLAEMKQEQVENRLGLLKEKEQQLKALEKSIDGKIRKLQEERDFFAQTVQKEKDVQKERLEHLVGLYKKMEPKKAAPVFEGMHRDLAVGLFKQIDQKQIMRILEVMNPAKAVELSEYYSRIRSAREYDTLKDINRSLLEEFQECKGMPAH